MGSGMPDYGFGRCDGHHEMVDFKLSASCRAKKGGRGSDPRLLGLTMGWCLEPHMWGATPCIKIEPNPEG